MILQKDLDLSVQKSLDHYGIFYISVDELDFDQDRSAKNDIPNGREDIEDKRCLRKRPPVEYFPKDGNRQAKPENLDEEDTEKMLTVLNWYKTECRFKDKFRNATREPCDQTKSLHKTTKFVRTNGLHLWQTKTVLMSLPDDRENENNNPDRVVVTSYIKGDINKTESIMNHSSRATESEVNENINSTESCSSKDMTNAECYLVDALNCSFRSDIVKDFEIDGLLNELDIHPVGLPESDQELRCHENVDHINLGSEPAVPESVTATPSTALDTSKEYTAEPLLMENQVSSNQAQCIDYVKGHLEYEDNDTESMFSHDTNEDVEFDIIKKQVEHVRNGLASPFLDLQLGNPTKAQNNELPEDYMKNGRDNIHDVLDFEKTGYMHNADVSIPVKIDGPEKCGKNTEDAIHEVCKIGQVGIASSHAVESNLNDKDKPESSIENEIDKDREILGIGQVCQTDGADEFNLDEKDDLEGQHKHGAAKRKINGSRILDRLKMDISGNGQSFKEIGEAMTFQYLTDDRSQNYFQSIPEKVKFDQRRKRKGSDVEETATMVCYHTQHDRDRENSTLHFSEPSPNSNCTTFPMAIETEPLNLSMHLDCRSDMNIHSTPVKKERLTITNGAMQISSKNRQDGFQKSNTSRPKCVKMSKTSLPVFNSKENDQCNAQKQCEQSSMQPEPLDLSVHDLKSSTENHVSNHQEKCVTVNKRVLRTRASVEYFPEKKKKRNNKGLRQNNKQVENSLSRPSNMNVNCTDCDENNKDCRPYIYFDPMELSPEPLDLSVDNKDKNAMDFEIERQIDGLCHGLHKEVSFRDEISEILAAQNDPSGLTGIQNDSNENAVTNTDMNNNTIKDTDEIDGCKPDEEEKAVNVHAVLVGLYAATNSKEGPPKTFLSGSEKFINGTRAYEIDELRNDNREFDELRSDNREDGETVTSNKDKTEDQEFDLVRGIKEKNKNISKFGSSTPTDLSSEPVRSVVETTFEDLSAENMMETSTIENNEENDHDNSSTTEVLQSSNVNVNDNLATSILNAPEQVSVTTCSQSEGLIENNKPTAEVNSVASKTTKDKHNAPDMTREIDTLTELRSCRQFNTQNNRNREVDTDRVLASGELAVEGSSNFTQVSAIMVTHLYFNFSAIMTIFSYFLIFLLKT